MPRTAAKPAATVATLAECAVDPLLIGADRDFLDSFPKKQIQDTGCLPIRRFRSVGLVVPPPGDGQKGLQKLQRVSDLRLISVPAIHEYGIDLFLRYWEGGDGQAVPPIWVPPTRRSYVNRLGDVLSVSGKIQPAATIASLLLTSPLAALSPVLLAQVGREAHAIFLHGTAGLKLGARFPAAWLKPVVDRLCSEFEMEEVADHVTEGKGKPERGLDDLTALLLPPLKSRSFIIEPRVRR